MATTGTDAADSLDGTTGADTIDGLAGADTINGKDGNDSISGSDGNDILDGGAGSDTISGGAGDDKITDTGGSDLITGGLGIDTITITRTDAASSDFVTVNAGVGADVVTFTGATTNSASVDIDAGAGANAVTVASAAEATVVTAEDADTVKITDANHALAHTGAGADVIEVSMRDEAARGGIGSGAGDDKITLHLDNDAKFTLHLGEGLSGVGQDVVTLAALNVSDQTNHANLLIRDFETGDHGDQLDLDAYFGTLFTKDRGHDWFENGHLRLIQDGADARLEIDVDGVGKQYDWQSFAILKDTDAHTLTAFNFDGVTPVVTEASTDLVV